LTLQLHSASPQWPWGPIFISFLSSEVVVQSSILTHSEHLILAQFEAVGWIRLRIATEAIHCKYYKVRHYGHIETKPTNQVFLSCCIYGSYYLLTDYEPSTFQMHAEGHIFKEVKSYRLNPHKVKSFKGQILEPRIHSPSGNQNITEALHKESTK
jgi:hypothetical protein